MQVVSRQLGHQSLKLSPVISSLNSIYQLTDHHYGNDHPRYASTLTTKGVRHLVRKGTGGRSSVRLFKKITNTQVIEVPKPTIGIVATVFGATGFLGRYVVQQRAKMGSQVFVPFRGSEDPHRHLKLMGDLGQVCLIGWMLYAVPFIVYLNSVLLTLILQIVPMKYNPRDENSIKAVMAKANVVINLIGREYETRNYSFEEVNQDMAEQLAVIAKEHGGIMRFIQVSCLGASSSSPSRMLRAKAAAEEAIMREIPEATILRPAVMIGTEDRILNRWAQFAKNFGFLPLTGDGSTNVQPVYVVDVASAIVTALNDDCTSMGKVFELGGPEVFTLHELAELMHDMIREWPRYVKVPFPIAKAFTSPISLVGFAALTFDDLGIMPHKLKGYPVEFLIQYRKGGSQYGSTVSKKVSPAAWPSKSSVL